VNHPFSIIELDSGIAFRLCGINGQMREANLKTTP